MFFDYVTCKTSPICQIPTFLEDLRILNPWSHESNIALTQSWGLISHTKDKRDK